MGSPVSEGDRSDSGDEPSRSGGAGQNLGEVVAAHIELLISEGHSFGEIRNYSFPQLLLFVRLLTDRWKREADAIKKQYEKDDDKKMKTSYLGKKPKGYVRNLRLAQKKAGK